MPYLLLVDNDSPLLRATETLLTAEGYCCLTAGTVGEARQHLNGSQIDLIVLDVDLPDQDGFSFCRRVRVCHRMPILFLTAREELGDKVIGLEVGADGYMTKPFDPRELVARIRAHLRRSSEYNVPEVIRNTIVLGALVLDIDSRDAFRNSTAVHLTEREFEVLHLLARHQGKAMASNWIFETVWGLNTDLTIKTLAVYMRRIRLKIEQDVEHPALLMTVRGFGYKLTPGSHTNGNLL